MLLKNSAADMEKMTCETSSRENSFHRTQFYKKITTRTVIPDEAMVGNLMSYEVALRSGKHVDLYLKKLSVELGALETIEPLLRTEIVDKLIAHFASGSAEGQQCILNAMAAVMKTNYRNIVAAKYVESVLTMLGSFSATDDMKVVLAVIKELVEIDEDVAESVLKLGGMEIILKASEFESEEVLQRCSMVILFIVLFGGKHAVNILMKNDINKHMLRFMHIFKDKTINYYANFSLVYLKTIHGKSNEFFENGLIDNVTHWLSENEMYLRENAAIECNTKEKLLQKLLPMLTSKSRTAQTVGTFQICCEITKSMRGQQSLRDPAMIKALKRIAVYSNEFQSTLATNALIVLTTVNDSRIRRFTARPLVEWSVEDIQRWLKVFGFEDYAIFFKEVNGEVFSKLKDRELKTAYFMVDGSVRKALLEERSYVCDDKSHRMIEYSRRDERMLAIEGENHMQFTNEEITAIIDSPFRPIRKTIDVFISYRRRGGSDLASLVSYHLKSQNYKVFLDVKNLGAGRFADELKLSIQKSANFLLLLTTDALERCSEENDWIRIEIEMALKSDCNIIPITRDFDNGMFESNSLPEALRNLKEYNQINWHHDAQDASLKKIEDYLKPRDATCFQLPSVRSPIFRNLRITRH